MFHEHSLVGIGLGETLKKQTDAFVTSVSPVAFHFPVLSTSSIMSTYFFARYKNLNLNCCGHPVPSDCAEGCGGESNDPGLLKASPLPPHPLIHEEVCTLL